jgi:hypothetical protein
MARQITQGFIDGWRMRLLVHFNTAKQLRDSIPNPLTEADFQEARLYVAEELTMLHTISALYDDLLLIDIDFE